MSRVAAAHIALDIATRAEIGSRDRQGDRARVVANSDGSWALAVADGLGVCPFGDEAAQAAVDALPDRIPGTDGILATFDAANAASWALHAEMRAADEGLSSVIALTMLVVAAWTPEGGSAASWVGDSMAFVVPVGGRPGWHSTPHGGPLGFVSRGIGMFCADRGGSYELPPGYLEHLCDGVSAARIEHWIGDQGLVVVLAMDGLFDPIVVAHDRGWFGDDPDDQSLGFALPADRRGSATDVADYLVDTAQFAGLIDDTMIAVARIAGDSAARAAGER